MERSPPFLRCNKLGPLSCVLPLPLSSPPSPLCPLNISGEEKKRRKNEKRAPLFVPSPSPPSLAPLVRTNALLLPRPPLLPLLLSRVYSCRYIDRGLRCQSMQEWEDAGWDGERSTDARNKFPPLRFRPPFGTAPIQKKKKTSFCAPFFCLHLYKSPPAPSLPQKGECI